MIMYGSLIMIMSVSNLENLYLSICIWEVDHGYDLDRVATTR